MSGMPQQTGYHTRGNTAFDALPEYSPRYAPKFAPQPAPRPAPRPAPAPRPYYPREAPRRTAAPPAKREQVLAAKQKKMTLRQIIIRFIALGALFTLAMVWVSGNATIARYNSRNYQMRQQLTEVNKLRTMADTDAQLAQDLPSLIAEAGSQGFGVPEPARVMPMKPADLLCGDSVELPDTPVTGPEGWLKRILG
ncbi:MAG: hypothetical protein FWD16_05085 [Clostridia bacterium]|nr:hypothetical protein [Clostridia bacterium]